jgi:hypothetical protein
VLPSRGFTRFNKSRRNWLTASRSLTVLLIEFRKTRGNLLLLSSSSSSSLLLLLLLSSSSSLLLLSSSSLLLF